MNVSDIPEEQLERVLNSRLFQKGLRYQKLADGVEVLEDEDEIFESLVTSITKQHSQVRSPASVREVLDLFREEVETFTGPLTEEADPDGVEADEALDILDGEGSP